MTLDAFDSPPGGFTQIDPLSMEGKSPVQSDTFDFMLQAAQLHCTYESHYAEGLPICLQMPVP
jgi:hypothetical protein